MHPEPAGLGMKSPSHSQRYVPISFTHRPLMHMPVTEHSSISQDRPKRKIYFKKTIVRTRKVNYSAQGTEALSARSVLTKGVNASDI